jgi:hypothetical protein
MAHDPADADGGICDPAERLAALSSFLQEYRPLCSRLVKNFFVESHWQTIPDEWHPHLEALSLTELAELLEAPLTRAAHAWPASLRGFVQRAHELRLPGQLHARGSTAATAAAASVSVSASGRCTEETKVQVALRERLKPKKVHEIVHLSSLVDHVARAAGCDQVVDLGSGLGYLSRTLAFEYNWRVIGVEADGGFVAESRRIDQKVARQLQRRMKDSRAVAWRVGAGMIRHVTARLPADTTPEQLWGTLQASLETDEVLAGQLMRRAVDAALMEHGETVETTALEAHPVGGEPPMAGSANALIGLHTCGDLSPTMLRVFHRAGRAVSAFVNVGCCYMKLSEQCADCGPNPSVPAAHRADTPDQVEMGFPMSQAAAALGLEVGYHLREHACHSLCAYADKLRRAAREGERGTAVLELHGRRAVLEWLLQGRPDWDEDKFAGIGAVKGAARISFERYVAEAYRRLGLPPLLTEEWAALEPKVQPMLRQWRRVVIFYVLRILLAPLWEAVVLLDRLLYLRELGYDANLVPLFDPFLSPRSYALVALKRPMAVDGAEKSAEVERKAQLSSSGGGAQSLLCSECAPLPWSDIV